ncbi:MAG: hypothetical protein V4574_19425 [Pseudomonadota bacterium]
MSLDPDAGTLLERALCESAEAAGCPLAVRVSEMTRWASITFTGARHLLTLDGDVSPALDAWLAALPEAEFALRDHLVADLSVQSTRREGAAATIVLEILTVEEG